MHSCVLLLLLAACTPMTRYRQTLVTSPATPTVAVGAPVAKGQVAVGANLSGYSQGTALFTVEDLVWLLPDENDPGVRAPRYSVGGHLRWAPAKVLELGFSFDYAHYDWTERSSAGVLEVPGHPGVSGFGPHITLGYMFGSFGFGGTIDAYRMSMPYAQYECIDAEFCEDITCVRGDAEQFYELDDNGVVHPIRFRWTNAFSVRHKFIDAAVGFAISPGFTNNGFSNYKVEIYDGVFSAVPVIDFGLSFPGVHVGLQGWYATNSDDATNELLNGLGGRLILEYRSLNKQQRAERDAE